MAERSGRSIALTVLLITWILGVAAAEVVFAEDKANFKDTLDEIEVLIIKHDDVVQKQNDLISNPKRPDGFVQFNKDNDEFKKIGGCHVYNENYAPCQWYLDKANELKRRREVLAQKEKNLRDNASIYRNSFKFKVGKLKNQAFLISCLAPFSARAHECAQLPDEAAYACFKELWDNSHC